MFVPNTFVYNGSVVIVFVALASLLYYVIAAVLVKSFFVDMSIWPTSL